MGTLGLIVNPIAGMGGRVGLKGTDGADVLALARELGAVPVAAERTERALARLEIRCAGLHLVAAAGAMGADIVGAHSFETEVLPPGDHEDGVTTADDTRAAAAELERRHVDLILFAGGDGTARDIHDAVGERLPILGVPTGVKMHSGVFATTPESAGDVVASFMASGAGGGGVCAFLFEFWVGVLAVTALRPGPQAEVTKQMKRAAADLIWSATAKVSREERAEVIRRLPPLLKVLREGMGHAGLSIQKQDEQIKALNNSLAAAFTAKTATIPPDRLEELMSQLETLEAMLPDTAGGELDETLMRDLSSHESEELEVVAEGGAPPSAAMLAWAQELQVGSWYMLDYRGRNEPVQLAWRGLRHHLILFVSPQGRGVLFQQSRLAAFLQAGLLLPAQDEALTVKATRNALAKLDADPERLLG